LAARNSEQPNETLAKKSDNKVKKISAGGKAA